MSKKVTVNKEVCMGCGLCTSVAPSVFEFDDDGLVKNIYGVAAEIPAEEEANAEEAAGACPVQAIIVD